MKTGLSAQLKGRSAASTLDRSGTCSDWLGKPPLIQDPLSWGAKTLTLFTTITYNTRCGW